MKLLYPLEAGPDVFPIGPLENGENMGTDEAHEARLGPGRFAIDIPCWLGESVSRNRLDADRLMVQFIQRSAPDGPAPAWPSKM